MKWHVWWLWPHLMLVKNEVKYDQLFRFEAKKFLLSYLESGPFSSIYIRCIDCIDSDAKLNNWTMEDWTQPRHPFFGAKLSRLQTLFARANKQTTKTTQFWRKTKAFFLLKNIFSPTFVNFIQFRPQTCSKGTCHSFLCVHLLFKLHSCFARVKLTKTNSEQAL